MGGTNGYRSIGDYGAIGNGRAVALVSTDGSIDWLCLPDMDSDAVFCRLLDAGRGGWFRVGPTADSTTSRRYVGDTNVLATTFTTDSGSARLVDLMPPPGDQPEPSVLRLVEGLDGEVEIEVVFRPTLGFAQTDTEVHPTEDGALARCGDHWIELVAPGAFEPDGGGGVRTRRTVREGERFWVTARHGEGDPAPAGDRQDPDAVLAQTLRFWEAWSEQCTYHGDYRPQVLRSALALKLLAYSPTGAVVAAPTTSLPETIGGERNWDYRYTWLRDASLIIFALRAIGYRDESEQFFDWLIGLCLLRRDRVQIMYRIDGGTELPERTIAGLEGWRGSSPVRVGNAAASQVQLDVYGLVLDAAHLHDDLEPEAFDEPTWEILSLLADRAADRWGEPDEGIWEVRSEPRHFLYSKLLCWVALDRALRIAERHDAPGNLDRWRAERDAIREAILEDAYNEEVGAFGQSFGSPVLDASALTIPLLGFLPPTDPRVLSTAERVRERLGAGGMVYRYSTTDTDDGLEGDEGTFVMCTFWLVDNLALSGDVEGARRLFEHTLGHASDLGLLSEQIDPDSGELLGNFPQGFSHLGVILSALAIAEAEDAGPEIVPETYADRYRRILATNGTTGT
jgi:alpha,alpha-trehalase